MKLVLCDGIGGTRNTTEEQRQEFYAKYSSINPDILLDDNNRLDPKLVALVESTEHSEDMGYTVVEIPDGCHYVVEKDHEYETEWVHWSESPIKTSS